MNQANTELWAIVELMGHQKVAGKLSEQVIGGASFIRVDVPATDTTPSFTRLLTDKAIYAINPVTEEVARYQAGRIQAQPIEAWDYRTMLSKQLQLEGKMIVPAAGNVVTLEGMDIPDSEEVEEDEDELD